MLRAVKKEYGQHFLVDENILGVIGRLAELAPDDVVLEIGPGQGVLTRYLAQRVAHVHAVEIDRALEPHAAASSATTSTLVFGDALRLELPPDATKLVSNLPYNVATPLIVESLDGLPNVGLWCVMVQREVADRLFAAAADEGVRRRLRARPARGRAHRLPSRLAHGLPAAAERRLGARRVPPRRDCRTTYARVKQRRRRGVRAPAQDAAELARARGRRVARSRRAAALAAIGRDASTRAEALAPAEFVALAEALAMRALRAGEDQSRARRRPAARRRQARGRSPSTSGSASPTASSSTPAELLRRRLRRRHARPRRARGARRPRRRRAALARADREAPPGRRRASAAAAPTPRPRSGSRTRRSPSRSRRDELHELAATLGADVPFFLADGPQLGTGDGTTLEPLDLPQDFWVVLLAPARRAEAVDRLRLRGLRRARRRRRLGRAPRTRSSTALARRPPPARPRRAAAERPRVARRSPTSCARSARSAPTSAAPARPSTGSSITRPRRGGREARAAGAPARPG